MVISALPCLWHMASLKVKHRVNSGSLHNKPHCWMSFQWNGLKETMIMFLNGTIQDDKSNFNKWNIYVSSDLKFQMKKEKFILKTCHPRGKIFFFIFLPNKPQWSNIARPTKLKKEEEEEKSLTELNQEYWSTEIFLLIFHFRIKNSWETVFFY